LSLEVLVYFKGLADETGLPYQKLTDLYLLDCAKETQETDQEVGGVAYSGALGRKFLRLDQFLKSTSAKAEENVPNPKLFP
jgi:hypothetical protein